MKNFLLHHCMGTWEFVLDWAANVLLMSKVLTDVSNVYGLCITWWLNINRKANSRLPVIHMSYWWIQWAPECQEFFIPFSSTSWHPGPCNGFSHVCALYFAGTNNSMTGFLDATQRSGYNKAGLHHYHFLAVLVFPPCPHFPFRAHICHTWPDNLTYLSNSTSSSCWNWVQHLTSVAPVFFYLGCNKCALWRSVLGKYWIGP